MAYDTRPAHSLTFEQACGIVAGPRPVSQDDPAGFITGCIGRAHADYGKVFPHSSANPAFVRYTFDREGRSFARLCSAPEGRWLEVQGRHFEIVAEVGQ